MKNVLFISHIANLSGAPLVLLNLLKEIKQIDPEKELRLIQIHGGPNTKDFKKLANVYTCEEEDNKVWCRWLPFSINRRVNKWRYKKWLKQTNFDYIYANTVESLNKAIEIKQELKIPIIAHIHEAEFSFRCYGITKQILQQCDSFIAVSSIVVNALNDYGVDNTKIKVIRPFSANLDLIDSYQETVTTSDRLSSFVVGLSGYGSWRKGTDLFPLLVKKFVTKYPDVDCKFVWVGYTNDIELDYETKRLNIESYIIRTGVVDNPIDYYRQFNVMVLTSREDPFPLVCMECAALAKPIILFENSSGIVDLVKHEESGLVVPYLDVDAMCDAIYRLYKDAGLAKSLGENARRILKKEFDMHVSLKLLLDFIM